MKTDDIYRYRLEIVHMIGTRVRIFDSITHVVMEETPVVAVTGSHGGETAAVFALQKGVLGAIFNDAGIGKARAGVSGLDLLDACGVPAACVDAFSACIGIGKETAAGVISTVNRAAQHIGVLPGEAAIEAAEKMARAKKPEHGFKLPNIPEEKEIVVYTDEHGRRIVSLDSNSMVRPAHRNAVVLTGSHGGLVGGLPAVKNSVLGAFFNDAGVGKEKAGISRLPWLGSRNIVGVTVSADSARIGVGIDTYENGIVSFVNTPGKDVGIVPGMTAAEAARLILETSWET